MQFGEADDLLGLAKNKIVVNNETVLSSCPITVLSDASKRSEKGLCLTEHALYIMEGTTAKRRIPIGQIEALTISQLSMEFVIHVHDSYDVRLSSPQRRNDIIERIIFIVCTSKTGTKFLKLYEVPQLNLVNVMTTEASFKNKKKIFPPESAAKPVDYEKYTKMKLADQKRATLLRKATKILVQNPTNQVSDLSIEDFELIKLLGRGAFGSVYLGRKKGQNKLYAIKRINKSEIIENDQLSHTKAEKDILTHVNHVFLVSLDYAFQTGANLYFVVEFMKGGELTGYLKKQGTFSESQSKFYVASIVLALAHLHNKNFVYRDLKLENLLMDDKGYIKITDFGLAKFLPPDTKTQTFAGTPEYIAPEILQNKGHDRMVDWWSLGILLFYFLYGKPPFYSLNSNLLYKKIIGDQLEFPPTPKVSEQAKDLISKLLEKDPSKRLGFKNDSTDILGHPWLSEIDITALLERSLKAPLIPETEGDKWESNFDDEIIQERFRRTDIGGAPLNLSAYQKEFDQMNFTGTNEAKR